MTFEVERNSYPNRQFTIQIDKIELIGKTATVDLYGTSHLVSCNIYESMYSNFTTGEITLIDNSGLFEGLPICGDEKLVISYKTSPEYPGDNYTKTFRVVKAKDLKTDDINSKTRKYELMFVSEIALLNSEARIRRAYKGMTTDKIVKDICDNILGVGCDIRDASKYPHDIVIPAWKPLYAINEMAKKSVRAKGYPSSNFLFFEDKDGFVFDSMDRIIQSDVTATMDFHLSRVADPRSQAKIWNARSYNLDEPFDVLQSISAGMYGHRYHHHDIIKKKVLTDDYIYDSEFPSQPHLKSPELKLNLKNSSFPEQKMSYGPRQKGQRYESEHSDDYIRRRSPQLRQIEHYPFKCVTEGNTNVTVGQKIKFDLQSNQPGQNEPDKKLSGNCVITGLVSTITNKEHDMLVEIATESLIDDV
jgi:hypothetical protein